MYCSSLIGRQGQTLSELQPLLQVVFLDGHIGETEMVEQFFQRGLRLGGHNSNAECGLRNK